MLINLVDQINNLSDSDAVLFLQYFNQSLLDGITEDFETLMNGIPPEIKSMPEFAEIDRLSLDETASVEGEEGVTLARNILALLANNPRFSPLLEIAINNYANIEHLELGAREEILSGALAAAMIILAATSVSVEVKMGDAKVDTQYKIPEEAAVPVLVDVITKLSSPLLKSIKPGKQEVKFH